MALYDLYTAKVYYSNPEEGHEWKPVVQIKENASDPDSFAVLTHHDPRTWYTGEIEVKDFKECGLKQKSTIRLTQRIDKPRKRRKIGTLTPELAAKVQRNYSSLTRSNIIKQRMLMMTLQSTPY